MQEEKIDSVAEPLAFLREWNPGWKPKFFMCDFSEVEIQTIESCEFLNKNMIICKVIFQCLSLVYHFFAGFKDVGTFVYLCDFHQEQAWERWCRKSENGLGATEKEKVLNLLRSIASAQKGPPNKENMEFDAAVEKLRTSAIYIISPAIVVMDSMNQ